MNSLALRHILFLFLVLSASVPNDAAAQERGDDQDRDVIILFDSSASMLAEVDGSPKIDLARKAANDLLESLPAGRKVGLVSFGHGASSQCGSIDRLVPPGQDRNKIKSTLSDIEPRGFTPLSSAIEQVAEDYAGSRTPIEVFLISDGGDQCFRDPCELAKKLGAANAEFRAHVVATGDGEEVKIPELKCIAEQTGGRFMTLDEVTQFASLDTPPPVTETPPREDDEAALARLRLVAIDMDSEERLQETVQWLIIGSDSEDVIYRGEGPGDGLTVDVPPGIYDFVVITKSGERGAIRRIEIGPGIVRGVVVPVKRQKREETSPETTYTPPTEEAPPAVETPPVTETVPPAVEEEPEEAMVELTLIAIERDGGQRLQEDVAWTVRRNGRREVVYRGKGPGAGTSIGLPPGTYDFYVQTANGDQGQALGVTLLPGVKSETVLVPVERKAKTPPATTYTPPVTEVPPAVIERLPPAVVEEEKDDAVIQLRLVATELEGGKSLQETVAWTVMRSRTKEIVYRGRGPGAGISASLPPGTYDFYVQTANGDRGEARGVTIQPGKTRTVIVPIERKFEAAIRVRTKGPVYAGSDLVVDWKGPGRKEDYISIARADDPTYEEIARVSEGSPVTIQTPLYPGKYEVRYVMSPSATILTRQTIEVVDVSASLSGPREVQAGTEFRVSWQGPGYEADWITISPPKGDAASFKDVAYVREGNPVVLVAPKEAGRYQLQYWLRGRRMIAAQPISVAAAKPQILNRQLKLPEQPKLERLPKQ